MMLLRPRVMLCALSLALLSAGVAGAAVTTFVDLSALPGGGTAYPYGAADGINNSGQVTGCMSIGGLYSAFLYTSGTVYDLSSQFGNTGTTVTHATGINGAGQMSGMWGVPGKTAYYYSGGSAGTATALVLPGGTTGNAASGQSIDAAGDVVGYATASDGTGDVAAFFYRNSTATMYELGPTHGDRLRTQFSYDRIANAISPNGAYVVGSITYGDSIGVPPALPQRRAAYWTYSIDGSGNMTSTVTDLQAAISLPGASEALAVNNSGQMIGLSGGTATSDEGGSASYPLWFYHFGNSSYTDLTSLVGLFEPKVGCKTMCSGANLLNSDGQVAGEISVSGVNHAAIWD